MLVERGSNWDTKADEIAAEAIPLPRSYFELPEDDSLQDWKGTAPAIRVCVNMWMQEREQGLDFTQVPLEQVQGGVLATQTYITELVSSRNVVFRRKICVVGPSNWGKTSLIKSLTTNAPSLVHRDGRTIGIDQFMLFFEESLPHLNAIKKHEVTSWDFAGQDAYQTAHSLFFSARTLYVVCIDLESYNIARLQADLMTETTSKAGKLLNEFLDTTVLQWIRVILARQLDAEFVFVATKKDRVDDRFLLGEDGVLEDLKRRLQNVEVIIEAMKTISEMKSARSMEAATSESIAMLPTTHLEDPRLVHSKKEAKVPLIVTSCVADEYLGVVKREIQDAIVKSDRGFPMPDKYSLVLKELVQMRLTAAKLDPDTRVSQVFVDVGALVVRLIEQFKQPPSVEPPIQYSGESSESEESGDEEEVEQNDGEITYLDAPTRSILQTLRDLGDVLWYDTIDDALLKNTVILDPLLMIDLVREAFNHKLTAEVMTHQTLQGLKYWKHLDGETKMLSMKRTLHHFDLVYPASGTTPSNSDLIVPAYWKSNTCAFWMFGGGDLRFGRGIDKENVTVRVHFEFQFINNHPDTLYDQLEVKSYSAHYHRDVGLDWVMYKDEDMYACRLMFGRDHATHHPTLHLEALLGLDANADHEDDLWACFLCLAESREHMIRGYPGVVVYRFIREDVPDGEHPARFALETLQRGGFSSRSR